MIARVRDVVAAFVCGALLEAISVLWVRYAVEGRPAAIFAVGVVQATAMQLGLGEGRRSRAAFLGFALGYGAGAALAVLA